MTISQEAKDKGCHYQLRNDRIASIFFLALVAWFAENGTFNNSLGFDTQNREVSIDIDICTCFCFLSLDNLTYKMPAMILVLKKDSKIRTF